MKLLLNWSEWNYENEERMYKISVKTLQGNILTFSNVDDYKAVDGIIIFKDKKTNKIKRFSVSAIEIDEEVKHERV